MSKLTQEQKELLANEIIKQYGEKNYYELTPEQKEFCANSNSDFIKSMLNWKRGVSINQYIYIVKAIKEKPIQDRKFETRAIVKETYLNAKKFSEIKETEDHQTIEVYVNRFFQTGVLWNWGKTLKLFGHYECLCGEKIVIVDCGRFTKNLKVGQVCLLKGKIQKRTIELTTRDQEKIIGDYYVPYTCKIEGISNEAKVERNKELTGCHEKPIPNDSGFNILL